MNLAVRLSRRGEGPASGPVVLTQRRIYILPTRSGLLFGMTLAVMLLGCVNYNLGLGYLLTFLLAGTGLVGLLHTFRNLAHLRLRPGRVQPVFAGDTATFPVLVENASHQARYAVGIGIADASLARSLSCAPACVDLGTAEQVSAGIHLQAVQRGRLVLPWLRVSSTFPLGLFRAWSYVHLEMSCIVYPRPESGEAPLPTARSGGDEGPDSAQGRDDFAGLRMYQPGDSLRQVAWKAVARGQPLMTKQFCGPASGDLWLSWNDMPASMHAEARIARLTRWVVDAGRAGVPFGMELPGARFEPASGPAHEARCLTALALLEIHG